MTTWRVIITESESESGVAPVCTEPDRHRINYSQEPTDPWVFDCCCGPYLQCHNETAARLIATMLTEAHVEMCS